MSKYGKVEAAYAPDYCTRMAKGNIPAGVSIRFETYGAYTAAKAALGFQRGNESYFYQAI